MSVGAVNKQTGDRIPTAGMPAIDDALDLTSVNPVQNAIITAALADKQDKTDNNLETTSKTVVGAVNELRSGLTNYENQNNINLEVPNRKNLINSNAYSNGYFTSEGVLTENQYYYATDYIKVEPNTDYVVSGFTGGGAYFVYYNASKTVLSTVVDTTTTFKTPANTAFVRLSIKRDGMTNPQMELGTTASAYTPYIPSVESRIEAVESLFNSIFLPAIRLTAANDLDSVIKPGAYYFRDADNPANVPASNCYIAVIRQYDNSPRIAQIAYSFSVNTIYVRKTLDWGSTWGDWYSLDNTQVTQ